MADSEAIRRLGDQLFSRTAGAPLAPDDVAAPGLPAEGDLDLRVVASTPGTAGSTASIPYSPVPHGEGR